MQSILRLKNCFFALAALFFLASCSTSSLNVFSQDSAPQFKLPPYRVEKLASGVELLFIEDRRLPAFSLTLLSRAGSRIDPSGQGGITLMMASLLEKGAGSYSATELADAYGQYGSDFDVDVDLDYSTYSVAGLSKDQNSLIDLFSKTVLEPHFSKVELDRLKAQAVAVIRRGYDNPSEFANLAFNASILAGHPYGTSTYGSIREIQSLSPEKIKAHYKAYFTPENSILAVTGDYSPEAVEKIRKVFGAWKAESKAVPNLASPKRFEKQSITLIERSDLQQAQVRFGHIGIDRKNPDFLAVRVANVILGGTFSSRLMNRVRTQKGLTYGISSGFTPRLVEGPFAISTFTRFDKVGETVKETLAVVKEFRESGVTADEVKTAVGYLKGAFPRALETPEMLASNLLTLRLYGIPDSYLTDYLADISRLSVSDINRAVKKYFHPDHLQMVVYATQDVKSQLEAIGPLQSKSYREFMR